MYEFSITKEHSNERGKINEYCAAHVYNDRLHWKFRSVKPERVKKWLEDKAFLEKVPTTLTSVTLSHTRKLARRELTKANIQEVFEMLERGEDVNEQEVVVIEKQKKHIYSQKQIQEDRLFKLIEREREEKILEQKRRKQAEVLWNMYEHGEAFLQVVEIPKVGGGTHRQTMLLSHHSKFAV